MPASRLRLLGRADQRAERADHVENARDVALVEGMHGDIGADQLGRDVGLQIGKGEHQVGLEREDFRHVGGDEGGDARLLPPHLRRPHRIAGDADDAAVLAEQIERLDGLFRQANDSLGRIHGFRRVLLTAYQIRALRRQLNRRRSLHGSPFSGQFRPRKNQAHCLVIHHGRLPKIAAFPKKCASSAA